MVKGLGAELKQKKPFALVEEEVHLSIVRTAAVLDHAFGQVLKPYGLTGTQYNVLRILRGSPDGLCRNELGARLLRQVPDVTRLLDRLMDMGLIARERTDEDRRLVRTRITKDGLALLGRLDDVIRGEHRRRLAHIPQGKLRELAGLLEQVRAAKG